MKISKKTFNNYKSYYLILFLIVLLINKTVLSLENEIIFKIDKKAFTTIDLENRKKYLDFVGNNTNLSYEIILNDFISANLFYEHYINLDNKTDLTPKIIDIFNNIKQTNKINKRKINNIDENNILYNINIDYVRKIILEDIINSNYQNFNKSIADIDLLYKFKIKYFNFENDSIDKIKNEIVNLKSIDINKLKIILNNNNINFFYKENEIINIDKINHVIRDNILLNKKFFIIEDRNKFSIIFIEKNFETFEGINVNLFSISSKDTINKEFLSCEYLKKNINNINIISKEYKLSDLNNNLKSNLISINDHLKLNNEGGVFYVILCGIKFDKEILNNYNFNKIIDLNVSNIENKLIDRYSKKYNLMKFDG